MTKFILCKIVQCKIYVKFYVKSTIVSMKNTKLPWPFLNSHKECTDKECSRRNAI